MPLLRMPSPQLARRRRRPGATRRAVLVHLPSRSCGAVAQACYSSSTFRPDVVARLVSLRRRRASYVPGRGVGQEQGVGQDPHPVPGHGAQAVAPGDRVGPDQRACMARGNSLTSMVALGAAGRVGANPDRCPGPRRDGGTGANAADGDGVRTATWLRDEESAPVVGGTETKCRAESYSKLGGCMSTMPRAEAIGGWRSLS